NTATGAVVSHTYATAGTYTVTLTVTDNDDATGEDTTTVTVLPAGLQTMHIEDVTVVLFSKFRGWRTWAEATVLIVDGTGSPLPGVSIRGEWTGATSGAETQTTDSRGVAHFGSATVRRPPTGATFRFTVADLSKSGYAHDGAADIETGGSVSVP
ncbi:MAG: PKD domain-containing protein, partial [Chloroflexota bacterium]